MCGISGVFHYAGGRADGHLVSRMNDVQKHRGPDDHGVWTDGDVALGNRRLSILDLSPAGHQPMPNEDESLWVVYNGEIYGWPELRAELASRGHRFRGGSDTEGLLHLYEERGSGFIDSLRGMFAFALFDRPHRRLLLVRDRMGIKPLYYHDDGRRILFASEMKALLLDPSVPRRVDVRALAEYLAFQYVPAPATILQGVRKLPPGHSLVASSGGVHIERYWRCPAEVDRSHDAPYFRERLRSLLEEAVRLRLQADVPVGAFLSGGLDSSAVVALMARVSPGPVKTFSIGFEEQDHSELEHARLVARHVGAEHTEFVVRPRALDLIPRLAWQYDEPFADPSAIPTFYVSEMARHQVTAALTGDGGDEVFAGYETYASGRAYHRLDLIPGRLRQLAAAPTRLLADGHPLRRRARRAAMTALERHLDWVSYFRRDELAGILTSDMRAELGVHDPCAGARRACGEGAALGALGALARLDAVTYLPDDVLTKVDRASMLNSLEARVPLLDHKVVEFAATIPWRYKLRGPAGKWILREAVRDLLPPETLVRPKQGFALPIGHWLGADFGRLAREVLLDSRTSSRGFFDPAAVERLLARTDLRVDHQARKIWALVWFEVWARTYLDRPGTAVATPLDGWNGSIPKAQTA